MDITSGSNPPNYFPAIQMNGKGKVSLFASGSTFGYNAATGSTVLSLLDPYEGMGLGATTYATFGTVPGQLTLDGASVKKTATAAVAGATYSIGVQAISGDGKRRVGETFDLVAQSVLGPSAISFVAGATPGTVIANITGVPSGSVPVFTPDDGRVIVSGNEANGWKLVVGLSVSASNFSGSLSAMGAAVTSVAVSLLSAPALSNNVIADNAPFSSIVGAFTGDFTNVELLVGSSPFFTISGSNLVTHASEPLWAGSETIICRFTGGSKRYILRFEITILPSQTWNALPGITNAWDMGQAVATAGAIDTVPAAYGSQVLTGNGVSGKPQVATGIGPKGMNLAQTGTSAERRHFSISPTIAPTNGWVLFVGRSKVFNVTQTLIGNDISGTTGCHISLNLNGATVGSNSRTIALSIKLPGVASAQVVSLAAGQLLDATDNMYAVLLSFDQTNQTMTIWVNSVEIATVSTAGIFAGATGLSFASIGKYGSGQALQSADIAAVALGNMALTTAQARTILAFAAGRYTSRQMFYSPNGNDANTGWNMANAKKDAGLMAVRRYNYPGDEMVLDTAGIHRPSANLKFLNSIGTANVIPPHPCVIRSSSTAGQQRETGSNAQAKIRGSFTTPKNTAYWTNAGAGGTGNTRWTGAAAQAAAPYGIWMNLNTQNTDFTAYGYTLPEKFQPWINRALSYGAYSYTWASNVVTVELPNGVDPNSYDIEIVANTGRSVEQSNNQRMVDLDFAHSSGVAQGPYWINCYGHDTSQDVFFNARGIHGCVSACQGPNAGDLTTLPPNLNQYDYSSTSSDGITVHGGETVQIGNALLGSRSFGMAHLCNTNMTIEDNDFILNAKAFTLIDGGSGVWTGPVVIRYNKFVVPAVRSDASGTFNDAIQFRSAPTGNMSVTLQFNQFIGLGTARGYGLNRNSGTIALTANDNTFTGFLAAAS